VEYNMDGVALLTSKQQKQLNRAHMEELGLADALGSAQDVLCSRLRRTSEEWAYRDVLWYTHKPGYLMMMVAASVCGNLVSPLFFVFNLFQLFGEQGPVQVGWVFNAFGQPGVLDKLVKIFLLSAAIQYVFAVVSYLFAWNWYSDYNRTCSTLYQCFFTIMMEGFKSDGMGDAMMGIMDYGYPSHLWTDGNDAGKVAVYVWVFFMLIDLILVVIVTSIVIDAFGQLRDLREAHTQSLRTECFICGLTEEDFVKVGRDAFDKHIHEEHNAWAYVSYFHYIYRKSQPSASGEASLSRSPPSPHPPALGRKVSSRGRSSSS
jgi:hypothetical protein